MPPINPEPSQDASVIGHGLTSHSEEESKVSEGGQKKVEYQEETPQALPCQDQQRKA